MEAIKKVLVLVLLVSFIGLSVQGILFLNSLTQFTEESREALSGFVDQLDATLQRVQTTSQHLDEASLKWKELSEKQTARLDESTKEFNNLLKETKETIKLIKTDTIPKFNTILDNSNNQIILIGNEVTERLRDLEITTAYMNDTVLLLNRNVGDPNIGFMIQNATNSTKQVELALTDVREAVHRITRPPSLAQKMFMGILVLGDKLGSIVGGLFK